MNLEGTRAFPLYCERQAAFAGAEITGEALQKRACTRLAEHISVSGLLGRRS